MDKESNMTERRVSDTERRVTEDSGRVNVTVERNSEGTVYRA